jgi:hypothetical protein
MVADRQRALTGAGAGTASDRQRALTGAGGVGTASPAGRRAWIVPIVALFALACVLFVTLLKLSGAGPRPALIGPIAPVSGVQAVESSSAVRDAAGGSWEPDRFSHGGTLLSSRVRIANTDSPALYRAQREGIRSIDVPLRSNGSYLVVLYFAETADVEPGERIFEVVAQGRRDATVDLAAEVGVLNPYHLAFTVSVPGHRLSIQFLPRHGQPTLSALRVTRVNPAIELPARHLAWSDEFNGPRGLRPNPTHWRYNLGGGWGQSAVYTDAAANASLDGHGNLMLTAHAGESSDASKAVLSGSRVGGPPTSARITTQGLFEMRYGSISARVKAAGEPGVVSTFWALGANIDGVGWPRLGEIDPLEVRGEQPRVLVQALHMPCPHPSCPVVWERTTPDSLAAEFHTFTIERAPGVVIYLLDGRQTASLTAADVPRGAWVFDRPFFLILNLIVGGWGGKPTASTHWPVSMAVDWVRAFT